MQRLLAWAPIVFGALALALSAYAFIPSPAHMMPAPRPAPIQPDPCPDGKCPKPKPWGDLTGAAVGGPKHADGTEVDCDLPTSMHVRNRGGSNGAGLCVYASAKHSGLWADEPVFSGLFEFQFSRPGGSYPSKFDADVAAYCKSKNVAKPDYIHAEGADLDILRKAISNGILPGVTYYKSPTGRYGGQTISHMVSLVAAGPKWFGILDNNYPGSIEWQSAEEFRKCYTGGRSGWALIPLKAGPPPVPRNVAQLPAPIERPRVEGDAWPVSDPWGKDAGEGYVWWPCRDGDQEQMLLYRHGAQVGAWHRLDGYYLPLVNGRFGARRARPPVAPPTSFGLDASQLSASERYSHAGHEVSRADAAALIEAAIPDYASKIRITVLGEGREAAINDLKTSPALAAWRDRTIVSGYDPSHWHIAKMGFLTDGKFHLYAQDKTGTVLHRQDTYSGAADLALALDRVAGGLRVPAPNYDPKRDADARNSLPGGLPWSVYALGGVAAIGVGAARLRRGSK